MKRKIILSLTITAFYALGVYMLGWKTTAGVLSLVAANNLEDLIKK